MTHRPVRVVVMGVTGSGKSTIGARLRDELGANFAEADDFHLSESVEKMSRGIALTDDDRWPWLVRLLTQLRSHERIVVTCSALRRTYRDLLRRAGDVQFVFLDVDPESSTERLAERRGHFMPSQLVASQFATLERPTNDERDVIHVDATLPVDEIVALLRERLLFDNARAKTHPVGENAEPILSVGDASTNISGDELRVFLDQLIEANITARKPARVLLVPPDHTRLYSRAGEITAYMFTSLRNAGIDVAVLPALGTHAEMTPADTKLLFGDAVPYDAILHHRWRDGLVELGTIGVAEVRELSSNRLDVEIPVAVSAELLNGWDLVVSIGQVVPHEVIGMANFTKNLVIGLGGAPTVHRSHFLGAVSNMETLMGRAESPVRHVVDAAFDRFVANHISVLWILTVMEDTPHGVVQRGLFAGTGRSSESGGAAYRAAAQLALACNVDLLDEPMPRIVCRLDPDEFRTTWLGNKAVYRTRMAIADGGELIVLAPGVTRFGEDPAIDTLIRRHGYHGTPATLRAVEHDPELAASLGAAAHLIHGSSEGRFTITYCTDPDSGGLRRDEVEAVGFSWRSLPEVLAELNVDQHTTSGDRTDRTGRSFHYIANPALGLWATRANFEGS